MNQTRRLGFTLLELLIVVIIVGILAGAALPQFNRMTRRARLAEGQNMVGSILTAEALYYNEFGVFTTVESGRLMVDIPLDANSNWDYTTTAGDNTVGPVTIRATGDTAVVLNIIVDGTLRNDGSRTTTISFPGEGGGGC